MSQDDNGNVKRLFFRIASPSQFRSAIARLRLLEDAPDQSPLGRERDALEIAVSRYLVRKRGNNDSADPGA